MVRMVETHQSYIEQITYRINESDKILRKKDPSRTILNVESFTEMADEIGILRASCSIMLRFCVNTSTNIFGGAAYIRSGNAARVIRIYKDVIAATIAGGMNK